MDEVAHPGTTPYGSGLDIPPLPRTVSGTSTASDIGTGQPVSPRVVPTVSSLSPSFGPPAGGNTVIITGTGLSTTTAIHFGPNNAGGVIVSDTQINATAPAGAGTVPVSVTTTGGTSNSLNYTYTASPGPNITNLNPNAGPAAGGNTVTITGTNLTGTTAVHFGGNTASFTVNSSTQITATAPAGTGTVLVNVTTPSGTSNSLNYTYVTAPTITTLNPNAGPAAGGNTVTVTGANLTGTTAVTFDANAASFTVVSPTQINAVAPAGGPGGVSVTVTTPSGTSNALTYTYVTAPTISTLNPGSGPTSGGNAVTIIGTGFTGASSVTFGAASAAFTVNSSAQITATVPAGQPGPVQVTVTATGGTSNAGTYFYIAAPTVTGLSPNQGPTGGTNTVTITGRNLTPAGAVSFGGIPATSFTVVNDNQINATAPAGTGTVNVAVTTPGGTSPASAASAYAYLATPTIGNLDPNQGPTAGGNTVTITGTNLTFATGVTFSAMPASFIVLSDTQVAAVAPPGSAGSVPVRVSTPGGTSAGAAYTYVAPPGG